MCCLLWWLLYIDMGNEIGLVFFIASLRYVGTEAFDLLACLATIFGIRVVGILHALGTDQLLVTYRYSTVLGFVVLFAEHTAEKRLALRRSMGKDVVDDKTECQQTFFHRFAIRAVYGLLGILVIEFESLVTEQLIVYRLDFRKPHLLL